MTDYIVLIDAGYLNHIAKTTGSQPDLAKLPAWVGGQIAAQLNGGHLTLLRVFYYIAPPYQHHPPTPADRQRLQKFNKFRQFIESLPQYEIRLGRLALHYDKRGKPIFEQKRVDVLLATDMLSYALTGRVSDIALFAGDSDFIPAVEKAKRAGVRVWLFHGPRKTYHNDLYKISDGRISLVRKHNKPRYPIR